MGSVLSLIASSFSFRIGIRFSSLTFQFAKGHVIESTIGSWTRLLNPINLIRNEDGALGIAMGFSFRFGIQDWFDFGFRIGARKPAPKPTGKEVLVHTSSGYHVRYTGSVGRRVELKDDVVCLCSHTLSQQDRNLHVPHLFRSYRPHRPLYSFAYFIDLGQLCMQSLAI